MSSNFQNRITVLLLLVITFSCDNSLQKELDNCNRNLYNEQMNSRSERDMLMHYIETFSYIQGLVDSLAYEKEIIIRTTMNTEFRYTKQDEIADKIKHLISILDNQSEVLVSNFETLSLKDDQIYNLEKLLNDKKNEVLQFQNEIGLLLKENNELKVDNENLGSELSHIGEELSSLKELAQSYEGKYDENNKKLLQMINNQEKELNRLEGIIEQKRCILVLNRSMSSMKVENNRVILSCTIKPKHILSQHSPGSFQLYDKYISIIDENEFWKNSKILLISMNKGNCQLIQ